MTATLGLGTATFDTGYGLAGARATSVDARRDLVRDALDGGIRYVDTAGAYGDAERVLGDLADTIRALGVRVCSKVAHPGDPDEARAALARLRAGRIDTVLIHSASRAALLDAGFTGGLRAFVRERLVARVGASTYGADDARLAIEQPWCDVVQLEHSILNPAVLAAAVARKRPGQEIVVRSVLCKGLLSVRRAGAAHLDEPARAVLDGIEACAREWGLTLPELAIRFALDTPGVDVVLVGLATRDELATALAAAARPALTGWQRERLQKFDRSSEDWTHPERWAGRP